ncbi:MAG TPA: proton-conducting transporter membrane subunit [Terriglobia bacterium]
MEPNLYLWLIPALPLLGATLHGFFGKCRSERLVAAVAVGSVVLSFLSFLVALRAFWLLGSSPHLESHFPWIAAADFQADFNFYLDPLSAVMALLITGGGLIVHVYAAGRMPRQGGYHRFFARLNLFLFFLLTLVLGGNYLLLFVGWEGIGLCSSLLSSSYLRNPEAADAGKKSLLGTALSDFSLLVAVLLLYKQFYSLNFGEVLPAAARVPAETDAFGQLTWICLLLLLGAAGRLPDAMRGRMPVGALIHAAAMVAAGVYVIARSRALYVHAPLALLAVAVVAGIAALYAVQRYGFRFLHPLAAGATEVLWKGVDQWAIDGAVNQVARRTRSLGQVARRLQSGNIRSYAGWVVLGAALLIGFMVVVA